MTRRHYNPPWIATSNAAMEDPTVFSALTVYLPAFIADTSFTVSLENVPSLSIWVRSSGWISTSSKNQCDSGFGSPVMLTVRMREEPPLSRRGALRELS